MRAHELEVAQWVDPEDDLLLKWRQVIERSEARGEARGLALGLAQGRAEDVLRILDRRGIQFSEAQSKRIRACRDLALLDQWFDRALTVRSAQELFG